MSALKQRRCAIYTRKSSEEGLEQGFNSLQAQREACEAYIKSQVGEGWVVLPADYDDGGFSGGSMERPALQRLLADIKERRVDIIVVYKVDRLTRSLADFAKMVEVFDGHGVSFVAVTQQFNTTSSMGRLTLNVLLSFAQFEREVIGERVRDKIAASKRKGMWMGGNLPLGYDADGRKLVINPAEAETVRHIFRRYLALGDLPKLKAELDRDGILSKARVSKSGNKSGGLSMGRSALYFMLNNPVYIGAIRHKAITHPGQHERIIDKKLWEAVQARLAENGGARARQARTRQINPLAGKLFDAKGEGLAPVYTTNHGRKYRYYVSPPLARGTADATTTWRLPAREIERAVAEAAISILTDTASLTGSLREAGVAPTAIRAALDEAAVLRERLSSPTHAVQALAEVVERVEVSEDALIVGIAISAVVKGVPIKLEGGSQMIERSIPIALTRRGQEMRLLVETARPAAAKIDPALLKAVARGWTWFENLTSGAAESIDAIAQREEVTDRYVARLMRLAFLAPKFVEQIAAGEGVLDLTAEQVSEKSQMPFNWSDQRAALRRQRS